MELVEVEITGQAITARYGTLNTGDILRTDAEFAKHLVNDCGAAKYTASKTISVSKSSEPVALITRKRRAPIPEAIGTTQSAIDLTPDTPPIDTAQDAAQEDQAAAPE